MRTWQKTVGVVGLAAALSGMPVLALAEGPSDGKIIANPVRNYQGPETVTVNGKPVTFDQKPAMVDGTLMLPLRAIIEATGGDVQWDNETQTATAHLGNAFGFFTLGQGEAEMKRIGVFYSKRNMIPIQHAPVLVGGRLLIPVDALTTILGFSIKPGQYTTLELTWPGAEAVTPPDKALAPLDAVQFVNPTVGWAGGKGSVLATVDGGQTWTSQYSGSANITALDFVDTTHGWALTPETLLHTTDGGKTWTSSSFPDGVSFASVDFTGPDHGWATAKALFETKDGGGTWAKVNAPIAPMSIAFTTEQTGWLAASKTVCHTADGGKSWQLAFSAPLGEDEWHPVVQAAGHTAWALFTGGVGLGNQAYVVFRTTDEGATWKPVFKEAYFSSEYPTAGDLPGIGSRSGPFAVSADGAGHFMGTCPACDVPFTITGSNDNGATWHTEPIPALQGSWPFAITFADADRGWIVGSQGDQGIILRTMDGGKTWTQP